MKKNKIILFDFDGVIVNSIDVSFGINKEWDIDLEFSRWQSWFEGNIYKTFDPYLAGEEMQIKYFEKYKSGLENLLPVEGMEEVLKELNLIGYELIIVSSSIEKGIRDFLEKNNLDKYFIEIMAKETSSSKVEKFKMVLKKYEIEAGETLIVTDTVGDVKEAKKVGIKAIGTSWGVHESKQLIDNGADFVAQKPEDIVVGIKKILA